MGQSWGIAGTTMGEIHLATAHRLDCRCHLQHAMVQYGTEQQVHYPTRTLHPTQHHVQYTPSVYGTLQPDTTQQLVTEASKNTRGAHLHKMYSTAKYSTSRYRIVQYTILLHTTIHNAKSKEIFTFASCASVLARRANIDFCASWARQQ